MFNTMISFVLAAFLASAVHGLPIQDEIKNKLTAEHETVQGVIDIEDAFGDELRFHESDDELAFLENGVHEDMGDEYYTTALRVNHVMPAHDEIDTLPVLLLQNKRTPAEKGHYLVELKNLVSKACRRELEDHLDLDKTCSCIVVGRDLDIIDGFSFVSTRSCLDKCILNNDEILPCEDNTRSVKSLVVFVEENVKVKVDAQSTAPIWSLDRIDARSGQDGAPFDTAGMSGAGVDVFVVDTGIRTSHVDFGGRARDGFSAIQDGRGSTDCNGHGTHCAGTVGGETYGVAKGVSLIAVRTLDCRGSGKSSGVLRGYDWVLANKARGRPAIISASLGGPFSQASKNAVRRITAAGVSMIVAAGNENTDACNGSPASEGGAGPAVTVAASDSRDRRASFSCYGRCADIFAPGVGIKSADEGSNRGTDTMSGTSMATPAVAGAAALYLSGRPDATPAQVKAALICKSTPGKISDAMGTPNRMLFVGSGATCGGSDTPAPPRPTQAPAPAPAQPSVVSCLSTANPCVITASSCPIDRFSITLKCHSPAVEQDFTIRDNTRMTINGCRSCTIIDGPGFKDATPAPVRATPSPTRATPSPTRATPSPTRATPAPVAPAPSRCRCRASWRGDGMCDRSCNNAACNYDDGDCKAVPTTPAPVRGTPAPSGRDNSMCASLPDVCNGQFASWAETNCPVLCGGGGGGSAPSGSCPDGSERFSKATCDGFKDMGVCNQSWAKSSCACTCA